MVYGHRAVDVTGRRFGKLVALGRTGERSGSHVLWACACDCGNFCAAKTNSLLKGFKKSCGCLCYSSDRYNSAGPNYYKIVFGVVHMFLYDLSGKPKAIVRVSKKDYEIVAPFRWYLGTTGYAMTKEGKKHIRMHRLLMQEHLEDGVQIDHINGNRLDNRRSNLRCACGTENSRNIHAIRALSGYKGVTKRGNRWRAQIKTCGKVYFLGSYATPKEAAKAYNAAAEKLFGEFASLNVLDNTD